MIYEILIGFKDGINNKIYEFKEKDMQILKVDGKNMIFLIDCNGECACDKCMIDEPTENFNRFACVGDEFKYYNETNRICKLNEDTSDCGLRKHEKQSKKESIKTFSEFYYSREGIMGAFNIYQQQDNGNKVIMKGIYNKNLVEQIINLLNAGIIKLEED